MSASVPRSSTHTDLLEGAEETFRLDVPPDASFISVARLFAASVGRHFGCREEVVEDLKVAISETITNAVKAHHDATVTDSVVLEVRATRAALVFSITDAGRGFDFVAAEPLEHDRALERGSLGLALVRSLFETTDVRRNEGPGMTVTFSLDLATAREEA